jgi:hypothetical protein
MTLILSGLVVMIVSTILGCIPITEATYEHWKRSLCFAIFSGIVVGIMLFAVGIAQVTS